MTHDAVRLADEVRILELEVQKLEFEKRITELETGETIDEGCIGCAGPCNVVDVAAKMQKELDECSNMNSSLHEEIYRMKKVHGNRKAHIHNLTYIADALETERDDLKQTLSAASVIIKKMEDDISSLGADRDIVLQNDRNVIAKLREDIRGLEAELSARKEDSAVLMKVVDIIKDDTIPNSKVPCMICNLVDAYLDAPEGPPETPIDDLYRVSVFLEMP